MGWDVVDFVRQRVLFLDFEATLGDDVTREEYPTFSYLEAS